jgi:hypothetical protein
MYDQMSGLSAAPGWLWLIAVIRPYSITTRFLVFVVSGLIIAGVAESVDENVVSPQGAVEFTTRMGDETFRVTSKGPVHLTTDDVWPPGGTFLKNAFHPGVVRSTRRTRR